MKELDSNFVDVSSLRIGLFVELDVGWLAHPFPTGSFKISSAKQIETIRGLGLKQVRFVPEKSDPEQAPESGTEVLGTEAHTAELAQRQQALIKAQMARQQLAAALSVQQRTLVECERRFADSTRLYRKAIDLIHTQPQSATAQCAGMVSGYVGELLGEGEIAIRLLSETAGDKAAMHPVNVMVVSLLLGKSMGLKADELQDLGMAAFLHDIGKTTLPERVRWPDDSFSSAETKLYQEHVLQGVNIGKTMALSSGILLAIAQHHELIDGSGYPARLRADSMTGAARILALVNRYDNLCNPGKPSAAMTPHEALSLIFSQLKSRFDAAALSAFIRMMGVYPPGSVVQLADERYASVVSVNSSRPLKPRVIVYESGVPKHEALVLDLEHAPNLGIRRSLKPAALPAAAQDYLAPRQRISYFFERVMAAEDAEAAA
jgi:HD-GYP domain-containing protein (c-di-GMP phosphodiesterase class II)